MLTAVERDLILADLIKTGSAWDPAATFIGLFVSINPNGTGTDLTDLVVPTGAPGVRKPVTSWSPAHIKGDGRAMVDSPTLRWTPASPAESTAVQGWYAADALTAGNLLRWGLFDTAVVLPDETSSVSVIVRYAVDPNTGTWDATVALNG